MGGAVVETTHDVAQSSSSSLSPHDGAEDDNKSKQQQRQKQQQQKDDDDEEDNNVYRCLVLDSGPLIRSADLGSLWKRGSSFYTVPAVIQEVRDAKARDRLAHLPFELQLRTASAAGIAAATEFARRTGDYQSLSAVDVQVLGLLYDLESEGCGGCIEHVRTTPKRVLGVGKVENLNKNNNKQEKPTAPEEAPGAEEADEADVEEGAEDDSESSDDGDEEEDGVVVQATLEEEAATTTTMATTTPTAARKPPSTWAMLVNPQLASTELPTASTARPEPESDSAVAAERFGKLNLSSPAAAGPEPGAGGGTVTCGQFSDADEEEEEDECQFRDAEDNRTNDAVAADPPERNGDDDDEAPELREELPRSDFPSLAAASLLVPGNNQVDHETEQQQQRRPAVDEETRKQQSLLPVSKSGKMYISFRSYGHLMEPKKQKPAKTVREESFPSNDPETNIEEQSEEYLVAEGNYGNDNDQCNNLSRIIGASGMDHQSGQDEDDFEDDGEGWITCAKDLKTMKEAGRLNPWTNPSCIRANNNKTNTTTAALGLPPTSQRAACATTDFAMQNVILQMNLELLTVDGIKVKKLKSWVTRCGACYKVYPPTAAAAAVGDDNNGIYGPNGKRLFCGHCGSGDMMQRIAASVDGKTGRIRLHFNKKYRHNLRGTKYSLPKPGGGNRFGGDLLLREDQLLERGVWNQKYKMSNGKKAKMAMSQSVFGREIATSVNCNSLLAAGDGGIRVGFGRRNPNATKGGRERRGKKKKTPDKACGLRRY